MERPTLAVSMSHALAGLLCAWVFSRLVCKTKQVLLPNILFLSSQNSGSSEGEDSHGTYPSFRMQCFLVLGLQTLFLYLA